ncbi:MAG: HEAT repeat domain-containing protein [Xenococcaceae cyanobacterium]
MLKILEKATAATRLENWSLVNQCLQQLPLGKNGDKLLPLEEIEIEQALKLALQVLKESDFQQRWEVAKIFPKLGKRAIAPLMEILEDEEADLETRWFVGRILSQFEDPAIVISLVKLLGQTEDEELSVMASQALANIGTSAIEALSSLLTQEGSRLLAVQSLAHIRRPEIIDPLLRVVDDPLLEVRSTAIEALGSFHDSRIPPVLVRALKDPAAVVRKEAAIALGLRADRRSQLDLVNQLKPLLYDLNQEVCQQAAIALGRMGTDDAAEALFWVLKSPATPVWLKLEIVRALSWIKTVQGLEYLQEGLRWGDPKVCQEIVTVLGHGVLPDLRAKATQILIDFLNSGQGAAGKVEIKQALAMSLGELGQTQAINPLLELAADSEQAVRLHAIAALKKFPNVHQQKVTRK